MNVQDFLLYSDDALLAINKPAGLRTIADGYNSSLPHLAGLLNQAYGKVWVVHRLDKDTSGVLLFARSAEAHRAMNTQFEQRQTHKTYHAIVIGMPEWEDISIDLPLQIDGDRKHRTIINHQTGKAAETSALVLERLGVFTLLAARPHTGYTHQIRAHLAAVGLPLLADPLYKSLQPETQTSRTAAAIAPTLPVKRMALHAFEISFTHPVGGEALTLQAPYPEDFQQTVQKLREQFQSP